MMPFITSQFMPRTKGDRPLVRPMGTANIAFIGQFCEIPDEVTVHNLGGFRASYPSMRTRIFHEGRPPYCKVQPAGLGPGQDFQSVVNLKMPQSPKWSK
jgi:hypothetical protein